MRDSEVHSAVVRWLNGLVEPPVIQAYQGGTQPALPYVMVNMVTIREVREAAQFDEYDLPLTLASSTNVLASDTDLTASTVTDDSALGDVTAKPHIETEWQFSVHCYGPNPTEVLRQIRTASHLSQMTEPLLPGLNVHELSQIRHVPDYVNERWEPRAQLDLYLRGIVADGFVIDTIAYASFDFERV